jgi:hypothetical protein
MNCPHGRADPFSCTECMHEAIAQRSPADLERVTRLTYAICETRESDRHVQARASVARFAAPLGLLRELRSQATPQGRMDRATLRAKGERA